MMTSLLYNRFYCHSSFRFILPSRNRLRFISFFIHICIISSMSLHCYFSRALCVKGSASTPSMEPVILVDKLCKIEYTPPRKKQLKCSYLLIRNISFHPLTNDLFIVRQETGEEAAVAGQMYGGTMRSPASLVEVAQSSL